MRTSPELVVVRHMFGGRQTKGTITGGEKEKKNLSISQCFSSSQVKCLSQSLTLCVLTRTKMSSTYFEAVKILLSTHVISLIEASVFISARASHVLTFHRRIRPPRHPEMRISE